MYNFINQLNAEIDDVETLYRITKNQIGRSHIGCLAVRKHQENTYYYEVRKENGSIRQRYLGTVDDERVGLFILKKVFQKRMKVLKNDLSLLKETKKKFIDYTTDNIISLLGAKYESTFWDSDMLKEVETTMNDNRKAGKQKDIHYEYEHSNKPFTRKIITCDGHLVRSKGECIIYDLLCMFHIMFDYEPTLSFYDENYNIIEINPDFYIECKDGSHIIIEHLGLLNDPDYGAIQGMKLRTYHLNGYDLGHNLIFTSDNEESGIDSEFISDIIKDVILKRAVTTE